jgi:hypothetical protein
MATCQPDKIILAGNFHAQGYSCPSGQAGITVCVSAIMEISSEMFFTNITIDFENSR